MPRNVKTLAKSKHYLSLFSHYCTLWFLSIALCSFYFLSNALSHLPTFSLCIALSTFYFFSIVLSHILSFSLLHSHKMTRAQLSSFYGFALLVAGSDGIPLEVSKNNRTYFLGGMGQVSPSPPSCSTKVRESIHNPYFFLLSSLLLFSPFPLYFPPNTFFCGP